MKSKLINIKLDYSILSELDKQVKNGLYASRTDFIREAIRKNILESKKQDFFKDLELIKSKIKKNGTKLESPILTEEQRKKAFEELLTEKGIKL